MFWSTVQIKPLLLSELNIFRKMIELLIIVLQIPSHYVAIRMCTIHHQNLIRSIDVSGDNNNKFNNTLDVSPKYLFNLIKDIFTRNV